MPTSSAAPEETSSPAIPRLAFPALLAGNIMLAIGPVFVRYADVGPLAAGFWRLALALPVLLLIMRLSGQSLSGLRPAIWIMVAVAGFFFAADLATWHGGILRTKIANATLFGNVTSLLLPLWGMIALRHRPTPVQAGALLLAGVGTAMLMGASYELSPRNAMGDFLCLLAGLFYTAYIIALQRARQYLGNWSTLVVSTMAGALPLLFAAWALDERIVPGNWAPVALLAMSSQVVGQGLLVYALVWFTPLVIGVTLLVQPIAAALVGWVLFGEVLTPVDGVGAVAIAVALVLIRLPSLPATRAAA
jgi:drug/metabolite transporter (DMT)-like permease